MPATHSTRFDPGRRQVLPVLCALPLAVRAAPAPAPEESVLATWIRDAEQALRGSHSAAVMKMRIERSDFQREYSLLVMSDDRGETGKVLIRMLGPALWRGHATLKVGDRISFYDPRTRRITVVGNSMLADNWMGSHFTNDDLMRETDLARHYGYQLLERQLERDELGRAVERLDLVLRPRPQAPVAWSRVHYRLHLVERGTGALPVKVDYFRRDADAQPQRSLRYSELRPVDGRPLPMRLTMQALDRPGEYTQIDYVRLTFGPQFGADDFTERALR